MDTKLPPLPGSDAESMQKNRYNGFYKVGSRDFWGNAEVTHNTVEEFKKCDHTFERLLDEVVCKTCHIGWVAPRELEAIDGKLFLHDKQVQF